MDVSTIGFLREDRRRFRILETLGKRHGATPRQVSHKLRIPQLQTDITLKELLEKGLIKEDKSRYLLSDEGTRALAQVLRSGM